MELAVVLRWPIRSRNGWHECNRCKRRLSWEWVWRGIVVKEEHKTPHLPILFERHKQRDLFLCKLCTPTKQNAQYYLLSAGWEKSTRDFVVDPATYRDLIYTLEKTVSADQIKNSCIEASLITQPHHYAESGAALWYKPVNYLSSPYTTGRKVSVQSTGSTAHSNKISNALSDILGLEKK